MIGEYECDIINDRGTTVTFGSDKAEEKLNQILDEK